MERSLRYLIDRSLPEFCEWIRTPEVAQSWAQPERYRRLARVHPLLARTVYQTLVYLGNGKKLLHRRIGWRSVFLRRHF